MIERSREGLTDNEPINIVKGVPFPLSSSICDKGFMQIEVSGIRRDEVLQGQLDIKTVTDIHNEELHFHFPFGNPTVRLTIKDDKIVIDEQTALVAVYISMDN